MRLFAGKNIEVENVRFLSVPILISTVSLRIVASVDWFVRKSLHRIQDPSLSKMLRDLSVNNLLQNPGNKTQYGYRPETGTRRGQISFLERNSMYSLPRFRENPTLKRGVEQFQKMIFDDRQCFSDYFLRNTIILRSLSWKVTDGYNKISSFIVTFENLKPLSWATLYDVIIKEYVSSFGGMDTIPVVIRM